jgi:hypothetical protein
MAHYFKLIRKTPAKFDAGTAISSRPGCPFSLKMDETGVISHDPGEFGREI